MVKACDLFVVGGGSGGVRAARLAAVQGAKVMLAERTALGGTCVNIGCIPKKLYYYAAGVGEELRHANAFARPAADLGDLDWTSFVQAKDAEIARLRGIYQRLLETAGVEVLHAAARLQDANTVQVGDECVRAERILLAVGGAPVRMEIPGAELAAVSDDLFALTALPKRVIMIGGGYIALEFAGIFTGLGVQTALCYRAELPMRGLDDDLRLRLANGMEQHGINLYAGYSPEAIERSGDEYRVSFGNGETLTADLVVFATGRRPVTEGLGLENVPIEARKNGTLAVNESFQTTCQSVYAVGDLLQTPALTPVATAEAGVFIKRVFGGDSEAQVDYDSLPTAIFSRPGVAICGVGEADAKKRGIKVAVYEAAFKPLKSGFAKAADESFVKLIISEADGRVIGAQMLGDYAAEILQGVAVAIRAGATKCDFDETIGIHPTSAEEFVSLRERVR